MKRIPIIDSHTGGEPTRVILSGISTTELETYRRAIICEPRGHEVIVGALLVEPKDDSCAAGVIFFNNVGYLGMCGHGSIGLVATLAWLGRIQPGDAVICFNFRTDRLREMTVVLSQQDMPEHGMHTIPGLHYVTMARYDDTYKGVHVMFEKDDVSQTLGEVLEQAGKTQVRIAETEKYPHVTFFFSGGRELPFEGERRLMVPSPKVATYDLQPEMSAPEITEKIMDDIRVNQPDFICLNFANTDMVGHTGVFKAAMKAAETVDSCLSRIVPLALEFGYHCLLIADHGNSDYLINEDGSPNTAHTKNPVPCILVEPGGSPGVSLRPGRLADVAPTLLDLMGVEKPEAMTGTSMIRR